MNMLVARREAHFAELHARKQHRLDIHGGGVGRAMTGMDLKAVGARDAGAVQQGVHDQRLGRARRRLFDPERPKRRELLSLGLRGLVGQAARRQTVDLAFAERSKVAGALEDGDLVEHGRAG